MTRKDVQKGLNSESRHQTEHDAQGVSGHTPGPWKVEAFGPLRVVATDQKGTFPICDIRGWGHLTGKGAGALGLSPESGAEIQAANARLIAAAPDLLAALEELRRRCEGEICDTEILDRADAALAKATKGTSS